MAFPLQLLALDSHFPVERQELSPTLRSRLGGGAQQVRDAWQRPTYAFTLSEKHADAAKERYLWRFLWYHRGSRPFWFFDNSVWCVIPSDDPLAFAYGDGMQTQFYLPNRYLLDGTLQVFVNGTPTSVGLDRAVGLVTFTTPPPLATDPAVTVISASYSCYYKVVFGSESDVLGSSQHFAAQLFKREGIKLLELVP